MHTFDKARTFIYRNARPLDLARWQYHFENGSREAVLKALAAYQNEDGGFGHALEADSFNPNSCPIQTWNAAVILQEVGLTDSHHPLIQGILRYLASGADFDAEHRQWLNVVPSNNDFPCAVWWKYGKEGSAFKYNPTAMLAGFILRYADPNSALYQQGCDIAREAVDWLMAQEDAFGEQHVIGCFLSLYEACADMDLRLFDRDALRRKLAAMLHACLDGTDEKWGKEYCAFPSDYIDSKDSPFYAEHTELVAKACDFIQRQQLPDGSYPVVWQWWTDHKEFEIAANWWKSDITIKYMRFLRAFVDTALGEPDSTRAVHGIKLGQVTLQSNDVPRLADFYRKLLGIEQTSDDPGHQVLIAEETMLTVYNDGSPKNNQNQNMSLAFTVDDIDEACQTVLLLGAEIIEKPTVRPWGAINMSFYDPDRNVVYLRTFLNT